MEIVLTWRELLIGIVLATVFYLLESAILSRRRARPERQGGHPDDAELRTLRAEMATLSRRLEELEARLGVAEPPEMDTAHAAYDYAVQYARQGMVAPEIAARCGISRDEAALIVAMHRRSIEP